MPNNNIARPCFTLAVNTLSIIQKLRDQYVLNIDFDLYGRSRPEITTTFDKAITVFYPFLTNSLGL
jgi:hypothetical protein